MPILFILASLVLVITFLERSQFWFRVRNTKSLIRIRKNDADPWDPDKKQCCNGTISDPTRPTHSLRFCYRSLILNEHTHKKCLKSPQSERLLGHNYSDRNLFLAALLWVMYFSIPDDRQTFWQFLFSVILSMSIVHVVFGGRQINK